MIVPTSNGGSQTTASSATTRPSARRTPSSPCRRRLVDRARVGDARALHARAPRASPRPASRALPRPSISIVDPLRRRARAARRARMPVQQHVARRAAS